MSGCRHNAKNTLVKNYLYLAEQNGADGAAAHHGHPDHAARGGRRVRRPREVHQGQVGPAAQKVLTAEHVVMAAASLGTQKLLHRMKDEGHLPGLSERLGYLSRTNSESILGAIAPKDDPTDYTYGVAITSSFHPDADTHVEPVRYGKGFNTMAMMQTVLTDGDGVGLAARRDLAQGDVDAADERPRPLRLQALVRADRDRAGHADASTTRSRPTARRARSAPGS